MKNITENLGRNQIVDELGLLGLLGPWSWFQEGVKNYLGFELGRAIITTMF